MFNKLRNKIRSGVANTLALLGFLYGLAKDFRVSMIELYFITKYILTTYKDLIQVNIDDIIGAKQINRIKDKITVQECMELHQKIENLSLVSNQIRTERAATGSRFSSYYRNSTSLSNTPSYREARTQVFELLHELQMRASGREIIVNGV